MSDERSFAERSRSDTPMTNSSSSRSGPSGSGSWAFTNMPQSITTYHYSTTDHQADLTAEALERLQISNETNVTSNEAIITARTAVRDGILRRQPSQTPSVTSISTGPDDENERDRSRSRPSSRQTERYMKDQFGDKGKGKGKAIGPSGTTISDLPGEVLISIFSHLTTDQDALSCMKVCKQWCDISYPIIWQRPVIRNLAGFAKIARVLLSPNSTQPYADAIRRINLGNVTDEYDDEMFMSLQACVKTERMTLGPRSTTSSKAMCTVFGNMPNLVAIDLSNLSRVDDTVIKTLAQTCIGLQGLNINGCKLVGDEAVSLLAANCKGLRRVNGCIRLTDKSLVAIARECHQLLEVDIADLAQCTSATVHALLLNSTQLRELKVTRNSFLDSDGFPDLPALMDMDDRDSELTAIRSPAFATTHDPTLGTSSGLLRMLMPRSDQLTQLRTIDLTDCREFTDQGLANLISSAPRIRALTLAKCVSLTDEGLKHIAQLGRCLHHLHIAHVSFATDAAVTAIARECIRMRYVDFACCPLLTDMSVFELAANVPKLKRVGLVKVINITDEAIHALVERASTLERLHLSYCNNLTVPAITYLLNKLPRLTHLSLTGVASFRTAELQAFCRPAPKEFNEHQAQAFCVFSGNGISDLRRHLNFTSNTSDDGSTRRDSASSGESVAGSSRYNAPPSRGRLPSLLDPSVSAAMGPAFASNGPNFLAPTHTPAPPRRLQTRDLDRHRTTTNSRNDPSLSSMPSLAPQTRTADYAERYAAHRSQASAAHFARTTTHDRVDQALLSRIANRPSRHDSGDTQDPVEPRYTYRQRPENTTLRSTGDQSTRRNSDDREIIDGRWMDAPAAYVSRMWRLAGLRRREGGGSPNGEGDQAEGSTRRSAWGPE